MADYVEILDTQLDPDAPITSQLGYQWRDNPIAIAEQASGAPKIATRNLAVAGTLAANMNMPGLGPFGGVRITLPFANSSGGSVSISLQYSTDGVTYSSITTIASTSSTTGALYFYVDFATGLVTGISTDGTLINQTIAGASLAITHLRVSAVSGLRVGAYYRPDGGESAS